MNDSLREMGRHSAATRPAGAAPLIPLGLDAHIVLLRHGETDYIVDGRFQGQLDSGLTQVGERQLALAGRRLAHPAAAPALPLPDAAPRAIVHSPLERARRGAELVAEALQAAGHNPPSLRPEPGLLEIGQGQWEGLTNAEIEERFGPSLGNWRRWPHEHHAQGGESLTQVRARVDTALSRVLAELADGAAPGTLDRHQVLGYPGLRNVAPWTLLIAHGGVFRVVLLALLGLEDEHFWNFDFGLGAITIVEIRAGRAVLRSMNLDSHLAELAGPAAVEADVRNASGAL